MLARKDLFREMADVNETFNRFFDQVWNDRVTGGQQWVERNIPLDLAETENEYILKASLPGLNPDDLDITFNSNVLTIKGEIKPDNDQQARYHVQERWYGPFQRSIMLPVRILSDKIEASYDAGVLTLLLPKSEEVRPKRIQIRPGSQSRMIEGQLQGK